MTVECQSTEVVANEQFPWSFLGLTPAMFTRKTVPYDDGISKNEKPGNIIGAVEGCHQLHVPANELLGIPLWPFVVPRILVSALSTK